MIHTLPVSQTARRGVLIVVSSLCLLSACAANNRNLTHDPEDLRLRKKFRGVHGAVLRIDAATPKRGVTITTETGKMLDGSSSLHLGNPGHLAYLGDSLPIPRTVHATWREGAIRYQGNAQGMWTGGTIMGDYTAPVADRIPDEILDYIRADGGALRPKIRLKDDGILIGWDVEERVQKPNWKPGDGAQNFIRYSLPGGDFREAQTWDGKVMGPGWQK